MPAFGKRAEPGYAALIGDVVASRRQPRRAALQRELAQVLDELNGSLGPAALAAPLALTAGDEIQGLFRRPAAVVDAVVGIAEGLSARLVYGLGYGPLATDLQPDPALLDGPCFHRARAALLEARARDGWVEARGFGEVADPVVSALFLLMHEIRSGWTRIQARHVREARRRSQKEVAARFRKAASTISESLKAADFRAILAGEEALRLCLAEFGRPTETAPSSGRKAKRRADRRRGPPPPPVRSSRS